MTLAVLAALCVGTVLPWLTGAVQWAFYPAMTGGLFGFWPILSYLSFLGLCLMPMIIDLTEDCKWNSLRSKI